MGMDDQSQIANYRLLKKIGGGTSGIVYQAQHSIFSDEPVVAIKRLRAQLNAFHEQERFVKEAQILRKLKHKHILSIIDAGMTDGFPYIVMEYAAGGSLRDIIASQKMGSLALQNVFGILA